MPNKKISSATFNVKLIHALLQLVQHQGISTSKALEHSIIEQEDIDTPGQRYSITVFENLLHELSQSTNNKKLAILAAEATQPRMLGCVGFVMTTANTLQDAYQMLGDYFPLIYEGLKLSLIHDKDCCILNFELENEDPMVTEFFIGCLLNWPRWLTGKTIPASTINLKISASEETSYHQQLATQVNFSQKNNQLIFSNQYMNYRCAEANNDMHTLHCNFADSLIYKSSQKQAIIAQTKHQIRKLIQLPQGRETLAVRREQVAQNLNMSLRTFQRKLKALDSNFQQIHDSVRQELCLQLMSQSEINFGQISYKLGFSNLSAFQKAFKRWMKTSPSDYRKKLSTSEQSDTDNTNPLQQMPHWSLSLNSKELSVEIQQRVALISNFSQQLLCIVALIQTVENETVSIQRLMHISGNSIARLSIYLWPAQQQELIANIDAPETADVSIEFTPEAVISEILATTNLRLKTELHYKIARDYQQGKAFSTALKHYFLCDITLLESEQIRALFAFSEVQLSIANKQRVTLNKIYSLMIKCQQQLADNPVLLNDLYISQLRTWVALAYFDAAHQRYFELKEQSLNKDQQVSLAIIASQLFIEINQPKHALKILIDTAQTYCHLPQLTDSNNSLFLEISLQLTALANMTAQSNHRFIRPKASSTLSSFKTNQLRILQRIITTCLQTNKPVQAASATAHMFALSLQHSDYLYASFASAHFAWVCSVFTGQIEQVKNCRERAIHLAELHSQQQLIKCKLILSYKVDHWLYALPNIKQNLQRQLFKVHVSDKSHLRTDVLLQYLRLCSGTPISAIHEHCTHLEEQIKLTPSTITSIAITNILSTTHLLLEKTPKAVTKYANYQNSLSAFSQLFAAFYNFQAHLWPQMQHWDSRIESETSSEFLITEAVFICTLMRLHCLEDDSSPQQLALEKRRAKAYIDRLSSWATLCPENFSCQYKITDAVYCAKFSENVTAIDQFEAISDSVNKQGFLHHQILYYHFYAQILTPKHATLASLCIDKKHALQALWTKAIEV